ncbi:hypothetical protein C6P45_002048 [Maudiozyma exigua]|uniref:Membrane anchor Opy2 N-terminal domain-containing protein n=1 Tax=Maudiozyma exigua TaxID=34358 RepID=A0A9P6VZ12_MAUEX|nr:hypothetical protein C6P45_002048 [Kazachstania exigua]
MSNSTTTTSSDGCVVCPTTPACPSCADDEYCVMTSLTCNKCPTTYCSPRSSGQFSSLNNSTSSTLSNSTNGNSHITKVVVGSVIGGIAGLLLLVMIFVYQWYWKPRRRNNKLQLKDRMDTFDQDDDFTDDEDDEDEEEEILDVHDIYDSNEELRNRDSMNNRATLDNEASDELTSLNDYSMKRSGRGKDIIQLRDLSNHSSTNNLQRPNGSLQSSHTNGSSDLLRRSMLVPGNRQSSASTIRTNSSNVLPIAYIPGVTSATNARLRHPNNGTNSRFNHNFSNGSSNSNLNIVGDTGSHITLGSSILGGLDEDFETMSMMIDHQHNNNAMRETIQQQDHIDGEYSGTETNTGIDQDKGHGDIGTMNTDMESAMDTSLGTIKIGLGNNLMTAIKAKPKLIQINEEDNNNVTSNATSNKNTPENYELDTFDDSHAIELQSIENDSNNNNNENDEDDNGSFLLDVEMPSSLRNEQISNVSSLKSTQVHPSLDPNDNINNNIQTNTHNDDSDGLPSVTDSNFKSPFDDAFELESETD